MSHESFLSFHVVSSLHGMETSRPRLVHFCRELASLDRFDRSQVSKKERARRFKTCQLPRFTQARPQRTLLAAGNCQSSSEQYEAR